MSDALFSQASHTLTLISQKDPTQEHLRQLHDGFLSDLIDAIMAGTLPDREVVRKAYGLASLKTQEIVFGLEPELMIDPIVEVDRSVGPSYPDFVTTVMHPELERVGPARYDISKVGLWLHDGQKGGKWIKGEEIYKYLKDTGDLKNHFNLRDLEENQKKGIAFFRKYFKGKAVFGWASVVRHRDGDLCVPSLYERGGGVVLRWDWLFNAWSSDNPGLRHASSPQDLVTAN